MEKKKGENDIIKKTYLAGIGFLSLAEERLKKTLDVWVKKGEKVEKEGKKTIEELKEKFEDLKNDIEKKIDIRISKFIEKLNIPTRADIERLEKRIEELEKKLQNK